MAEAAGIIIHHEKELMDEGFTHPDGAKVALPVAFDINMGCPVNKIFSNGEGSALMSNPDLIFRITKAVSDANYLPVTVKMRLGINPESINVMECAKAAEEGGARAICIHGRTRVQMYGGEAKFKEIAEVKSILKIPVIANGDITTPEMAKKVLEMTRADGIAIGRGAVGNPYLFGNIADALEGRDYSTPSTEMLIDAALKQLRYAVSDKGEEIAIPESRKQFALYLKGFRGASRIRTEINMAKTFDEVKAALLSALNNDVNN